MGTICHVATFALQVRQEVTSVFGGVFNLQPGEILEYEYLHTIPGLKKLKRPPVSTSYSWNGSEVASLAGQGSLYILSSRELPGTILSYSQVCNKMYITNALKHLLEFCRCPKYWYFSIIFKM